ncbi:DUF3570 domain-containing protein [Kaarinaea lacus]
MAVTDNELKGRLKPYGGLMLTTALGFCLPLMAAVLPEDRADFLYHSYSGGGIDINGPSMSARKQFGEQTSVWGKYYVDAISSASIDVMTYASPYTERREEKSLGVDFLQDKTTMGLSYTNSAENDFIANSAHFSISHGMFGDLTTVSMGYSLGWDVITATKNPGFEEEADRKHFKLGVSQILTKNLLMDLAFETITDEGFLNNPYRQIRYLDTSTPAPDDIAWVKEQYPNTRTSHAIALRGIYYLPYRAAIKGEYKIFNDTWGIQASMYEIGYTHPLKNDWILDFHYRAYEQTRAEFYSDLYPYEGSQNYLARDKELSTYTSKTIGIGASYEFAKKGWAFIDRGSANIAYNRIMFDYEDFRDARDTSATPGTEPLYNFSADVVQLYLSIWY